MVTFKNTTRGFTLIELLVVITIIGILATGATAVYTSQIQKARDTTRLNDTKTLQSGIEQVFQDKGIYSAPGSFSGDIAKYLTIIPHDPKTGQTTTKTSFDYAYNQGKDPVTTVLGQTYELSTAFENQGNIDSKAANTVDKGNDANRLELGADLTLVTSINGAQILAGFACVGASTAAIPPASPTVDIGTANCGTNEVPSSTAVMLIK